MSMKENYIVLLTTRNMLINTKFPKKYLSEPKAFEEEEVVNITSTFEPSSMITANLDRSRISHTHFKK